MNLAAATLEGPEAPLSTGLVPLLLVCFYGENPADQIDHLDRDRANNAIVNLRPATHAENARNREKSSANTSGALGASWDKKAKRWRSQIKKDGRHIHLGYFERIEDAAAAYRATAELHHGSFAAHRGAAA